MINSERHMTKHALPLKGLEGLTDGVFAIVMTLLVLGLAIPVFKESSMHQQFTQLVEMWPRFACYFVTFLMLGFVWSVHHRVYSFMKCSDIVSIWLNIICMMFASLLPFSTSLLAENIGQQLPLLIYEGNFFIIALFGYLNWLYVTGKYRLVNTDIDLSEVKQRKILFLSSMLIVAIAMSVSYLNTTVSISIFIAFLVSSIIHAAVRMRVRTTKQAAK